mmetsp:Transcript_44215/g.96123  ORF Transcript_44215/g.96123 Transcript_44215/m.96123 type:complete len:112 (-) Transcript_44215:132-467(-)
MPATSALVNDLYLQLSGELPVSSFMTLAISGGLAAIGSLIQESSCDFPTDRMSAFWELYSDLGLLAMFVVPAVMVMQVARKPVTGEFGVVHEVDKDESVQAEMLRLILGFL